MAQTQARMTALVQRALEQTVKDLGAIDLHLGSDWEGCPPAQDAGAVAATFTGHLCALLYPKQEPEVKP